MSTKKEYSNSAKPIKSIFAESYFANLFFFLVILLFQNSCIRTELPPPEFFDSNADFNANFDPNSIQPQGQNLPGSIVRPPLDPRLVSNNENVNNQAQNFSQNSQIFNPQIQNFQGQNFQGQNFQGQIPFQPNFSPNQAIPNNLIPPNLANQNQNIDALSQNLNPQNKSPNINQTSDNQAAASNKNNINIDQIYRDDIAKNSQNNFSPFLSNNAQNPNLSNNSNANFNINNAQNSFASSIIYRDEKNPQSENQSNLPNNLAQTSAVQNPQLQFESLQSSFNPQIAQQNFPQPSFPQANQTNQQPKNPEQAISGQNNFEQENQDFAANRQLIKDEFLDPTFTPNFAPKFIPKFIPQAIFVSEISNKKPLQQKNNIEFELSSIGCNPHKDVLNEILYQLQNGGKNMAASLPDCLKNYRPLMLKMAIIKPSEFQFANEKLKKDLSFVKRMIEIKPEILSYADDSLKNDRNFMTQAIFINRDALFYASEKLLDNKIFIHEMIENDSRNYIFASNRLQKNHQFAALAFKDDAMLIKYAPAEIKNSLELAKIAVKSDARSFQFISEKLKNNRQIQKLAAVKTYQINEDKAKKYLTENYIDESDKKNLSIFISNRLKFAKDYKIIDRNYIAKWHQNYQTANLELIATDSRNIHISWKKDFARFPLLAEKIEKFLLNRQVDKETINNLSLTYFFKVKTKPQTVLFNLYLLRKGFDHELGSKFNNITSLTAIAQKNGNNWNLSVVNVIFSNEIPIDISFTGGHKKYIFWDFYFDDKKDKNPKIIFKVEDRFSEYFEIFAEQNNQKYRSIYQIDLIKELNREANHPELKIIDNKIDRF